jgi:hypothetical protein
MARRAPNADEKGVRLSFQLFASDNALLVTDLLNVRKGKLRHARLVTLATLGLMVERRIIGGQMAPKAPINHASATSDRVDPPIRPLTGDDLLFVDSKEGRE